MKKELIVIDGMTCGHCVMSVKKELSKIAGLTVRTVDIGTAAVEADETIVTEQQIRDAITNAGYSVSSMQTQ